MKEIYWRAFVILNQYLFYSNGRRDTEHHYKTNP